MDGKGQSAAYAEDGPEGVGAGAQMGDGTQVLEGVALLLQRIFRVGVTDHSTLPGLDFPFLPGGRGGDQFPRTARLAPVPALVTSSKLASEGSRTTWIEAKHEPSFRAMKATSLPRRTVRIQPLPKKMIPAPGRRQGRLDPVLSV